MIIHDSLFLHELFSRVSAFWQLEGSGKALEGLSCGCFFDIMRKSNVAGWTILPCGLRIFSLEPCLGGFSIAKFDYWTVFDCRFREYIWYAHYNNREEIEIHWNQSWNASGIGIINGTRSVNYDGMLRVFFLDVYDLSNIGYYNNWFVSKCILINK